MTLQALYDQLHDLRLSAFRDALREQQANPKYNELTFEDRLALLVDYECTQRRENRIRRNIRLANFPMQAATTCSFLAQPVVENHIWLRPLAWQRCAMVSPSAITALPGF